MDILFILILYLVDQIKIIENKYKKMFQTSQQIYQSLLNSDLTPLQKFKSNKSAIVYPDALKYPSFFDNNLLSPGRVIKKIKGKSALLRSFGYQLMKIVFEIQILETDYIQIFKDVVFSPTLTYQSDVQSPISGQAYTDKQYKRILADFIQIMIRQNIPSFELTIMTYPIIEQALVRILKLLIVGEYSLELNSDDLLQWLSNKFQITMHRYGMCYKFEESDIFLYQQNQEQFYIAFLNQMAEVSDYSESTNRLDLMSPQNLKNHYDGDQDQNFKNSSASDIIPSHIEKQPYIHPSDKFRYSSQVNKNPLSNYPYYRTIDNHKLFSKQIGSPGGQSNEQNNNDKPQDKYSKIGSLLDMLSDRSRQDLSQIYKTPQSITERHPQELDKSKKLKIDYQQKTPQFNTKLYPNILDNYNPFTNKYSDQYLGNLYQKNGTFAYLSSNQNKNFLQNHYNNYQNNNSNKYSQAKQYYQPYEPLTTFGNINKQNQYPFQKQFKYSPETSFMKHNFQKQYSQKSNLTYGQAQTKQQEEDLFYNPKKFKYQLDHQVQKYEMTKKKYNNYDDKVDESKGSLYREFTDTRILDMVTSFQKMKITNIKKKYRGVHRKNNKILF